MGYRESLTQFIQNAFYAVNEKKKTSDESYQPTLSVQPKKLNDKIEIRVSDNGNGIPQNIVDKSFSHFLQLNQQGREQD
jgi:two-component system NtrC family sensor kinase